MDLKDLLGVLESDICDLLDFDLDLDLYGEIVLGPIVLEFRPLSSDMDLSHDWSPEIVLMPDTFESDPENLELLFKPSIFDLDTCLDLLKDEMVWDWEE